MRTIIYLILALVLVNCSSDDDQRSNPFLVNVGFAVDLNINLPQNSGLSFPGGVTIVPNVGIRGAVIYTLSTDNYVAYELSDPNHEPNNCSQMEVDGVELKCPCPNDINTYNLVTGQPMEGGGRFGCKAYRVTREGDVVRLFN